MKLYGLKNCDTCKKAMKALSAKGVEHSFVDIRAEADLATLAPKWLKQIDASKLINTRSTTWRQLGEAERAKAEGDPAGLLAANPTLVKRPVIERGEETFVGWTKDVQAALGV